jgi:hypothetical protein
MTTVKIKKNIQKLACTSKQKFNRDDPFGSGMESEMITNSIKSFSNKQQAVS